MSALWRVLASPATSALLALCVAAAVVTASIVPQGSEALQLARDPTATEVHRLSALGLTDVYGSAWFRAVLVLVLGNLFAASVSAAARGRASVALEAPGGAPIRERFQSARPELALEIARGLLSERFDVPVREAAEGARARLVFEVGRGGRAAPVLAHAGIMALVVGAALSSDANLRSLVPRAVLEITEPGTGARGVFDLVAGEPFKFFQGAASYVLRDYVPSREGLGPAVRFERTASGERPSEFWIYARAPRGFDARHRAGEVAMESRSMGASPKPGRGLTASPYSAAMAGGLALVGLSLMAARRPRGRVWAEVDGEEVTLVAAPELEGDGRFEVELARVRRELGEALAAAG